GPAYVTEGPVTFPAGESRVLLGQRHTGGLRAFLAGEIEEARLYDRALSDAEIATSFHAGVDQPTEEEWLAALSEEEQQRLHRIKQHQTEAAAAWETLKAAEALSAAWDDALAHAADDAASPLYLWAKQDRAGSSVHGGVGSDADGPSPE